MVHGKVLLMTPGPTMVDPEVLLAMAKPTINHVSPEFDEIHSEVLKMLSEVFATKGRVVVIPGSGTSAMELALRSVVKPGSKVVVLKAGFFGDYLARGVEALGGNAVVIEAPIGRGFTASDLEAVLRKHPDAEVVAFQHVDTSTSVANPLRELAAEAKRHGVKVLVDGVASVGGMEVRLDDWGVDVCFTGSQKALGVPPGLGIVAFSREYSEELEGREGPWSLYFNMPKLLKEMESTRNYYVTPAVNLVYALRESLRIILAEGLSERYKRHRIMAEAVRAALEAMGLKLVAEEGFRADTVTAAYIPDGVEWPKLYSGMRARGIEIAGGLGELKGRIFRIGHMGQTGYTDIAATIAALERTLKSLGYDLELGSGLRALQEKLHEHGV
ncbi:pyridoxal-phosphate-dependent aminotransferase family protein [Hyperthermus butylicus]|uniref:Serine-pyruvate aminotransferase/archaeal aspartate aminotransferase n=1 Tax=Hyperthermus butylicus (strain DSM 5456 / JCM 9403 / PLM1-5) TaxID=415426 RepID=A2BN48_HYPBU|nr:alanine--glyoxylate aminotransferase family protein [Hyperthermus butylicus]ABM81409.1 Serine-pyruvate aminotransferase/archaeal aspartate aminotransferase [Hyperthermus butylicus DSM 5456]